MMILMPPCCAEIPFGLQFNTWSAPLVPRIPPLIPPTALTNCRGLLVPVLVLVLVRGWCA